MKLRNKGTGEVRPAEAREDGIYLYDKTTERWYKYNLYLLAKYWQYYEAPKEYWYVSCAGEVLKEETEDDYDDECHIGGHKQIGNYFESEEKAEKAVEKLKAYKRLKDKGFVWQGWEEGSLGNGMCVIGFQIPDDDNWETDVVEDLELLFGEEEE